MTADLVMNLSKICCLNLSRHSKAVNCAASVLSYWGILYPLFNYLAHLATLFNISIAAFHAFLLQSLRNCFVQHPMFLSC